MITILRLFASLLRPVPRFEDSPVFRALITDAETPVSTEEELFS